MEAILFDLRRYGYVEKETLEFVASSLGVKRPTTDNLEAYGKGMVGGFNEPTSVGKPVVSPILPEYGTLNPPPIDPYNVRIGGVLADPYRVARAYGIEDPVIFQALKKLLRCGRKHKAKAADVRESITSLERWEAMNKEDAQ